MNEPIIETTDLTKFYGKSRGIENVNLRISEGEIFGFIGPNGAGKSTTLRILMNLIFPSGGSAMIMGMDVIRDSRKIKYSIGYIPSDAAAYSYMVVNDFLRYCARFYNIPQPDNRIKELSGRFDLDLKRKIADLSMGNRKKVSIIQSLLHRPGLLILDEPTTGLDPLMQSLFFELLRSENQEGMTIFFSSHVLNEVQLLCKRVAIIKEGRIIQTEEVETLRKKQLKKVSVEFTELLKDDISIIPGAENMLALSGTSLSFMYSGSINSLTKWLAEKRINNLIVEEPSLDDIFMHYYKS